MLGGFIAPFSTPLKGVLQPLIDMNATPSPIGARAAQADQMGTHRRAEYQARSRDSSRRVAGQFWEVFHVLQSHGWRPSTAESQPADNEQILAPSIILTPQSRAPNGYHYARYKRVNDTEGRLSFAGSSGQPVPLDGETLWIPQRVLLQ